MPLIAPLVNWQRSPINATLIQRNACALRSVWAWIDARFTLRRIRSSPTMQPARIAIMNDNRFNSNGLSVLIGRLFNVRSRRSSASEMTIVRTLFGIKRDILINIVVRNDRMRALSLPVEYSGNLCLVSYFFFFF